MYTCLGCLRSRTVLSPAVRRTWRRTVLQALAGALPAVTVAASLLSAASGEANEAQKRGHGRNPPWGVGRGCFMLGLQLGGLHPCSVAQVHVPRRALLCISCVLTPHPPSCPCTQAPSRRCSCPGARCCSRPTTSRCWPCPPTWPPRGWATSTASSPLSSGAHLFLGSPARCHRRTGSCAHAQCTDCVYVLEHS